MAQRLSIPIEFSCLIDRTEWVIGAARIVKWVDARYSDSPAIEMKVISPPYFAGLTQRCFPEYLPQEALKLIVPNGDQLSRDALREEMSAMLWEQLSPLPKEARKLDIQILIGSFQNSAPIHKLRVDRSTGQSDRKNGEQKPWLSDALDRGEWNIPPGRKVDAWSLRRDFLALNGSTDGLADFLNRYGAWNKMDSPRLIHDTDRWYWSPVIVQPLLIWNDRKEIETALSAGPAAWFTNHQAINDFNVRSAFPHYYHLETHCKGAIVMATTIDFLRQVKFRICPRIDCGQPFPVERKGKIYCSQYCAHLVSLRKTRKKQQSLRRKGK